MHTTPNSSTTDQAQTTAARAAEAILDALRRIAREAIKVALRTLLDALTAPRPPTPSDVEDAVSAPGPLLPSEEWASVPAEVLAVSPRYNYVGTFMWDDITGSVFLDTERDSRVVYANPATRLDSGRGR